MALLLEDGAAEGEMRQRGCGDGLNSLGGANKDGKVEIEVDSISPAMESPPFHFWKVSQGRRRKVREKGLTARAQSSYTERRKGQRAVLPTSEAGLAAVASS